MSTCNGGYSPADTGWNCEAQLSTLSLPKTGMAVAMDIMHGSDIHPLTEVGRRLALAAQAIAYGRMHLRLSRINDQEAWRFVSPSTFTEGWWRKGGSSRFQIAGKDHKFVSGQARIDGDLRGAKKRLRTLGGTRAWHEPGGNLYNRRLGCFAFRTDDWPTQPER